MIHNIPISISVCMMVKNESKNLGRCLSSVLGIADEIIVVDTGSSDDSVEMCKKYGAKVYHHHWENDFSLHRNQSIGYATKDWILIIDADEEFVFRENAIPIRKIMADIQDTHSGIAILLQDIQNGEVQMAQNTVRFFKNGSVHYHGIVHNQAILKGDAVFYADAYLNHYGYDLDEKGKQAKTKRTMSLLQKRIEKNPKDYPVYFYLSQLFCDIGNNEEALEAAEIYWQNKHEIENFNDSIYYTLIQLYIAKNDFEKADQILGLALKFLPECIDIAYGLMQFGEAVRDSKFIQEGARRFLGLFEKYENDPLLKNKRFTYTFNLENKAKALYNLSLVALGEGMATLNDLKDTLLTVPEKAKKILQKNITENFKKFGIEWKNPN